jgi:hypothetical protein
VFNEYTVVLINMKRSRLGASLTLVFLMLLGLLFSGGVFAADLYRVSARVFHLGELIAQPEFSVRADETTAASFSAPGESQYKFVVLVRPTADEEVYVSMQFSSGNIDIQPNLMVELGKEASVTIDKVRLTLLVKAVEEVREGEVVALND